MPLLAAPQPPSAPGAAPTRRREPPLPPMWIARGRQPRSPLARFVFLSMLLHALAILLFGAPGGGHRDGRALWGSLDVVIVKPAPEPPPVAPAPPPPPQPVATAPTPPKTVAEAPFSFPPLLDRLATPAIAEMEASWVVPPPTEAQVEVPASRSAPRPPEVAPPEPAPIAPPAIAEVSVPPAPLLPLQPEAPAAAMLEAPTVAVAPLPAPLRPLQRPAPPAAMLEAPVVEVPPLPAPPPMRAPVEAPVAPIIVPDALPALDPNVLSRRMVDAPKIDAPPAREPEPAAPASPPAAPSPRPPAPRESLPVPPAEPPSLFRAPRPGARPDDATPYDPTAPALDPEALRKRAGELAREGVGNRALLAFPLPPVPPRRSKLETAIENARKPDCKTAYQSLGLAAIVPLIANEFGEGKCRW